MKILDSDVKIKKSDAGMCYKSNCFIQSLCFVKYTKMNVHEILAKKRL
jgi:hypothetical protein